MVGMMMADWRRAQRQLRALELVRSTAREVHGDLGFPAPPEDPYDDDPDHVRPGWQLSWLTGDGPLDDLQLRLEDESAPPRWRYWRFTRWLASRLYVLGLSAGSGSTGDRFGWYVDQVWSPVGRRRKWDGRRARPVYVLGWQVDKWRCLLRYRHWPYWPQGRPVAFGHCGRCVPWTCCGSIEIEHASGCSEGPA